MHLPYLNPHWEPDKKVGDGHFGKESKNKQQKGNGYEYYAVTTKLHNPMDTFPKPQKTTM